MYKDMDNNALLAALLYEYKKNPDSEETVSMCVEVLRRMKGGRQ